MKNELHSPLFLTAALAFGDAFGFAGVFAVGDSLTGSNFVIVFVIFAATSSTALPTRLRPFPVNGVEIIAALLVEGIGSEAFDVDGFGAGI